MYTREVYPEVPVRIEYTLTAKGLALKKVFDEMNQWSQEWIEIKEESEKGDSEKGSSFFAFSIENWKSFLDYRKTFFAHTDKIMN